MITQQQFLSMLSDLLQDSAGYTFPYGEGRSLDCTEDKLDGLTVSLSDGSQWRLSAVLIKEPNDPKPAEEAPAKDAPPPFRVKGYNRIGDAIYLTPTGNWSRRFSEAATFPTRAAATAALQETNLHGSGARVVPDLIASQRAAAQRRAL